MATSFVWEGTSIGGEASRPEKDFAAERAADTVWHFDLIREEGMDDAAVALAEKYGLFPAGGDFGVKTRIRASGANSRERQYSRAKHAARKAELRALMARLK